MVSSATSLLPIIWAFPWLTDSLLASRLSTMAILMSDGAFYSPSSASQLSFCLWASGCFQNLPGITLLLHSSRRLKRSLLRSEETIRKPLKTNISRSAPWRPTPNPRHPTRVTPPVRQSSLGKRQGQSGAPWQACLALPVASAS